MKISFVGDIGLHNKYDSKEFDQIKLKMFLKRFQGDDLVIGNLETFAKSEFRNPLKSPILETSEKTFELLKGPKWLLAMANNHVYDTGTEGYDNTVKSLNNLNINYWGTSLTKKDPSLTIRENNNLKIAILNYVHSDTGIKLPENCGINTSIYNKQQIKEAITEVKPKVDFIFLYLHWGGSMDYGSFPDEYQIKDSRVFIDSGADAIIGTHNHSIQPIEYYKGKPIIYGLGHFLFDEFYFNNIKTHLRPSGKKGIGVTFQLEKQKKILVSSFEFIIKDLIPEESLKVTQKLKKINFWFKFYKNSSLFKKAYKIYLKKIEPKVFYFQLSDKNFLQMIKSFNIKKLRSLMRS
jgi:poly-gamma-glutamate synthesis protein (capsule biosynthesis protein)